VCTDPWTSPILSQKTLYEIKADRGTIFYEMRKTIAEPAKEWGLGVDSFEIKNIITFFD